MNLTHDNLIRNLKFLFKISGLKKDLPFMQALSKKYSHDGPADFINRVAQVSQLRIRPIQLEQDWGTKKVFPMLVFLGPENSPCVVFSQKDEYFIYGLEEKIIPLTQDVMGKIHRQAYIIFSGDTKKLNSVQFIWSMLPKTLAYRLLIIVFLMSFSSFLFPIANNVLFSYVIPFNDFSTYWQLILMSSVLVIGTFCFQYFKNQLVINLLLLMNQKGTRTLIDKTLRLPLEFFSKDSPAALATKIDLFDEIQESSFSTVTTITANILAFIPPLLVICFYEYSYALIIVLFSTILFILDYFIAKNILKDMYESQELRIENNELGYQYISAVDKLILSNSTEYAGFRWLQKFQDKKTVDFFITKKINYFTLINNLFMAMFLISIVYVADSKIQHLELGGLMAILVSANMVFSSLSNLVSQSFPILHIISQFKQVKSIQKAEVEQSKKERIPPQLTGGIEVNHLDFYYPNTSIKVLNNISLKIKAGTSVAFVGLSGSGKSTLLKCLVGLYADYEGTIFYDEHPLDTLNLDYLRNQCAFILQNTQLIQGSIYDNIALTGNYTHEEIMSICKTLGFDEWINSLPMNLHTIVNGTSSNFSGGQKQLIFLARALIRKPLLLFMDEATSALDTVSQRTVMEAIDRLNITRIVVAHRLSTVKHAAQIFVMNKGEIVERGTYQELLKKEGFFKKMIENQVE